jgi:tyrosyl-tRNA synthetase
MLAGGGIYLNNKKVMDENLIIESQHLIEGEFLLLGIGKKKKMVLQVK